MKSVLYVTALSLTFFGASPLVAGDPTIEDYTMFWKPVEGTWKMTNDRDGKKTTGTFEFKIAPNNKCVLLYHGVPGAPYTQQLQGYDPVAKRLVAYGFTGDGNFQIQTIGIDGMKKGLKAAKGIGGDWDHKIFKADGTTTAITSKWKWTHLEKDKIVMEWYDVKDAEDGAKRLVMTLERKEKAVKEP
jgi:hypothetical protein